MLPKHVEDGQHERGVPGLQERVWCIYEDSLQGRLCFDMSRSQNANCWSGENGMEERRFLGVETHMGRVVETNSALGMTQAEPGVWSAEVKVEKTVAVLPLQRGNFSNTMVRRMSTYIAD